MKITKRLLSLFLAFCIIFGAAPVTMAETVAEKISISSAADWDNAVGNGGFFDSSKSYQLTGNIDLDWANNRLHTPLNAKLYGNGYQIKLKSYSSGLTNTQYGLFSEIGSDGKVFDLRVRLDSTLNIQEADGGSGLGELSAGLIAAVNRGEITRCSVMGKGSFVCTRSNTTAKTYFGLVAGQNHGVINQCYVEGLELKTVLSNHTRSLYQGGIAGKLYGGSTVKDSGVKNIVLNSEAKDLTTEGITPYFIGGLSGYAESRAQISSCVVFLGQLYAKRIASGRYSFGSSEAGASPRPLYFNMLTHGSPQPDNRCFTEYYTVSGQVSWEEDGLPNEVTYGGVDGQASSMLEKVTGSERERAAFNGLKTDHAETPWILVTDGGNEDGTLILKWQYAPQPTVMVAKKDNEDYTISVTHQEGMDANVDISYTEKGITASPNTPILEDVPPEITGIESLYANGKLLGTVKENPMPIKSEAEVQLIAKIAGSHFADKEKVNATWKVENQSQAGIATVTDAGVLTISKNAPDQGTFEVAASIKPIIGEPITKSAYFITEVDKLELSAMDTIPDQKINMSEVDANGFKINMGLKLVGEFNSITPVVKLNNMTTTDVSVVKTSNGAGEDWVVTIPQKIGGDIPEGSLTIMATGVNSIQKTLKSNSLTFNLSAPGISKPAAPNIGGMGTAVFLPNDRTPIYITVSTNEPTWKERAAAANGAEIQWEFVKSGTTEAVAGASIAKSGDSGTTAVITLDPTRLPQKQDIDFKVIVSFVPKNGEPQKAEGEVRVRWVTGLEIKSDSYMEEAPDADGNRVILMNDVAPISKEFTADALVDLGEEKSCLAEGVTWSIEPKSADSISSAASDGAQIEGGKEAANPTTVIITPKIVNQATKFEYELTAAAGGLTKTIALSGYYPQATVTPKQPLPEPAFEFKKGDGNPKTAEFTAEFKLNNMPVVTKEAIAWSVELVGDGPSDSSVPTIDQNGKLTVPVPDKIDSDSLNEVIYCYKVIAKKGELEGSFEIQVKPYRYPQYSFSFSPGNSVTASASEGISVKAKFSAPDLSADEVEEWSITTVGTGETITCNPTSGIETTITIPKWTDWGKREYAITLSARLEGIANPVIQTLTVNKPDITMDIDPQEVIGEGQSAEVATVSLDQDVTGVQWTAEPANVIDFASTTEKQAKIKLGLDGLNPTEDKKVTIFAKVGENVVASGVFTVEQPETPPNPDPPEPVPPDPEPSEPKAPESGTGSENSRVESAEATSTESASTGSSEASSVQNASTQVLAAYTADNSVPPTATNPPGFVEGADELYHGDTWVTAAQKKPLANLYFKDIPQNDEYYYVLFKGSENLPSTILEVVDEKYQMTAGSGISGTPTGTLYGTDEKIEITESTQIAVCAKAKSTGTPNDPAVNLERSNTLVYDLTLGSESVIKLDDGHSQGANPAVGPTPFNYKTTLKTGPFNLSRTNERLYTASMNAIRALVYNDTRNNDSRDRGLAEGTVIQANATAVGNFDFSESGSGGASVGDRIPAPVITPGSGGIIGSDGITISCMRPGATIYYTYSEAAEPVLPTKDRLEQGPPTGNSTADRGKTFRYLPNSKPVFPDTLSQMTIAAVAVISSDWSDRSEMSHVTYRLENRKEPEQPVLMIGTNRQNAKTFEAETRYDKTNLKVFVNHPDIQNPDVSIYYTVGNGSEAPSIQSPKYIPSSENGIALPELSGRGTLVVRLLLVRTNYKDVNVYYTIAFSDGYSVPAVYYAEEDERGNVSIGLPLANNAVIRSGTKVVLELDSRDVPTGMGPVSRQPAVIWPDGFGYDSVEGTEKRVELTNKNYVVPQIRYGLGKDATVDQIYKQAVPILLKGMSVGDKISYSKSPAELPGAITLPTGDPGTEVVLRLRVAGSDPKKTATSIDLVYKIRERLPPPMVSADVVNNVVEANSTVTLQCAAVNFKLFYTLENEEITENSLVESIAWEKAYDTWLMEQHTKGKTPTAQQRKEYRGEYIKTANVPELTLRQYDAPFAVVRNTQMQFQVSAVAVSTNDTKENSEIATAIYRIKGMESADPVTAFPETSDANQTTLARGAAITLSTLTANPMIYYTTTGVDVPDPDAYLRNLDESGNPMKEIPTKRINSGGKVTMAPDESGVFVLRAMARENSTPSQLANGPEARFTYQLAKATAPTVSPATSEEDITKLPKGTQIKLLTRETGVEIYYTETGEIPQIPKAGSGPTAPTKLYSPSGGITMPEVDTFFILTAVTHDPTGAHADSDPGTYYFQSPAPVQAVFASPNDGESVVKGTTVNLNCSTKDATIFYEVAYDGKKPSDPVANKSQTFDSTKPIVIDRDTDIKAMAVKDGVNSQISSYSYKLAGQLEKPKASLTSGTVVYQGVKLHLSGPSGATVVYTKDGSDPTDETNKNRLFGNNLVLDGKEGSSMTIRAFSTKAQSTPSEVETFTYSICKAADLLRATPPTGAVVSQGTKISLSSAVSDGAIYYTTNGSDPAGGGKKGNTVTIQGQPGEMITLKAAVALQYKEYDDDEDDDKDRKTSVKYSDGSPPVVFTYTLMEQTQSPSASIPSGAITLEGASVALTAKEGTIYYTTDGTDPTISSMVYAAPIDVSQSMVLKAFAVADNKAPSEIVTYIYSRAGDVAAPMASLPGGEIESGAKVEMTTATEGAVIYYSTNGMTPSDEVREELFEYTAPIPITRPVTIKMYAYKEGMHSSPVNSVTYTVFEPPEPEAEAVQETGPRPTSTNRLTSRRTFDAQDEGPAFKDIVLYDQEFSTVLSAEEGAIPKEAQLVIKALQSSGDTMRAVQNVQKDFGILALYDITLLQAGEAIQPNDTIEIGLPIPEGYENGVVIVCRINDDGSAEFLPTRRAGGVAYVKVEHLSKYALTAPSRQSGEETDSSQTRLYLGAGGASLVAILGCLLLGARRRKQKKEEQP